MLLLLVLVVLTVILELDHPLRSADVLQMVVGVDRIIKEACLVVLLAEDRRVMVEEVPLNLTRLQVSVVFQAP